MSQLPEEYFEDEDDEGDFEDEWEFDCHMGRDGLCGAAGSEECEFECPYRADELRRILKKKELGASGKGEQG